MRANKVDLSTAQNLLSYSESTTEPPLTSGRRKDKLSRCDKKQQFRKQLKKPIRENGLFEYNKATAESFRLTSILTSILLILECGKFHKSSIKKPI